MIKENSSVFFEEESGFGTTISIKRPNNKYLDEALRIKCFPDMISLGLFPNAKEVTESFACYEAYRKHIMKHIHPSDSKATVVVVGDGHTPRTGAVFAFRSKFSVVSIDPEIKDHFSGKIKNLEIIKNYVQDVRVGESSSDGSVIYVFPHSHAKPEMLLHIDLAMFNNAKHKFFIMMPCCVDLEMNDCLNKTFGVERIANYYDWGIHSPKKRIIVYGGSK
jgi:hypothetical protein